MGTLWIRTFGYLSFINRHESLLCYAVNSSQDTLSNHTNIFTLNYIYITIITKRKIELNIKMFLKKKVSLKYNYSYLFICLFVHEDINQIHDVKITH